MEGGYAWYPTQVLDRYPAGGITLAKSRGTRNEPAAARIYELSIDDMARGTRVRSVRGALEGIRGVSAAAVSLKNAQTTMAYEPARIDVKTGKESVTDASYQVA